MWMIDSSLFIDWIKKGHSPILLLEPFVRTDRLVSCGIIRAEVLRGIVQPTVRNEMADFFAAVPEVQLTSDLWGKIADKAWDLDRKGMVIPLTNIAIALCVLEANAELITQDAHFQRIPKLKVRKDLPGINVSRRSAES